MSDAIDVEGEIFTRTTVDGRFVENVRRPATAAALGLEPHPEGGWYRRTWTAPDTVSVTTADGATAIRPAATLIHFFLAAGESSAWHRVTSTEIWLWHGPGRIRLQSGGFDDLPVDGEIVTLGPAVAQAEQAQATIRPHEWQRTLPGPDDVLVSCLVSPGFDFADFTMLD